MFERVNSRGTSLAQTARAWHPNYLRHAGFAVRTRLREQVARRRSGEARAAALEPRPYTRFVVAAEPRTVSTLLVALLDAHPRVRCHGEVAAPWHGHRDQPFSGHWSGPDDEAAAASEADPIGLLRDHVWPANEEAAAIGFKVFAVHARGHARVVLDYLSAVPDLRVIRLERDDRLAQAVSHERALRDTVWHLRSRVNYVPEPVTLTPAQLRVRLETSDAHRALLDAWFPGRATLRVAAEDLTGDRDTALRCLHEFLDVPHLPAEVPLKRVSVRPLREDLTNFDELAKAFEGTPWEDLFTRHR